MSLQNKLQGMLSSDSVNFQNSAFYYTGRIGRKKPKIPLKEEEKPGVGMVSADSFKDDWKELRKDVIAQLEVKLPIKFDYAFFDDGRIFIYLKKDSDKISKIKPEKILSYDPEGLIKIAPIMGEVPKVSIQAKYKGYGDNFNKRTIDVIYPDSNGNLVKTVVDFSYILAKNLNLI